MKRKPGISVLIAAQNEEEMVGLCVRSFLEFGDEVIVVDNGSTDGTGDVVRDLAAKHPQTVRFYDCPDLPDLYQNREFAFRQSSREWIVRADSDYVAYTAGARDIRRFREELLRRKRSVWPEAFSVLQPNVVGDFWHTGVPAEDGAGDPMRRYIPGPVSPPMLRIYRTFPGFRFQRRGRWEGVRFHRFLREIRLERPLWMHCSIKSDMNYFFRSERTNWRERGDFAKYPTLASYLAAVIEQKYGTRDREEAARRYMERHFYPYLQEYDPAKFGPYPHAVREQMARNPIYRIRRESGRTFRERVGR